VAAASPPAVQGQKAPAAPGTTAVGEAIEETLIRIQRREVVERHGSQAERYLPTEDRTAFLLPDNRLEPAERKWQKVFVALPWMVFACMLATPLLLVRTNLPWLEKRAEEEREAAAERQAALVPAARVPGFEVVSFGQMPDVLERPFPTVLLVFNPTTLASKVFLPAMRDVEQLLREAGIAVSVAALDLTASPGPPSEFFLEYPSALAPHMQLIVPRAQDGEAGVVDYDGPWSAGGVLEAARTLAGPRTPGVPVEELARLDERIGLLRDALFDLLFVEEDPRAAAAVAARRPSWWRRALRGKPTPAEEAEVADVSEAVRAASVERLEQALDLAGGLEAAISSCRTALAELRAGKSME